MVRAHLDEEAIFKIAFELSQPETRADYLNQVCGENRSLLNRVQKLLEAHAEAPDYLETPLPDCVATFDLPSESVGEPSDAILFPGGLTAGAQIGPYKIRELLAEGGMGVVYVAEQTDPVRRYVALKIIKPGMATREVLARFEAERQSLALMEHPHIARVIDAGATESGLPYFVMELVQGSKITEYCDENLLTTQDRLRLFVRVCRAVQHAHQKGIIHRDLKPSNVLVSDIDDQAIPKVIDFGIAKAVNQKLTNQTVYTQFSQIVGTPLYMSPEQTGKGVLDVDTRSDVYSLGVMLYELLTGSTPFTPEKLKAAGLDEMGRLIREQEPAKPSALISTLNAQALSTVAERRRSDRRKLRDSLKGELDWIVMRALEKDRNRRYETANAFAADIERYLNQEPIAAGPPSIAYKAKKFVQRNHFGLLTTVLLVAICTAGIVFAVSSRMRAISVQRQINQEVEQSLIAAEVAVQTGDLGVARQLIGKAEGRFAAVTDQSPDLSDQVLQLKLEIDERRRQQEKYVQFEQLTSHAIEQLSYWEYTEPIPSADQALQLFDVLDGSNLVDRLRSSYLSEQQQRQVQKTTYELLLLMADHPIRFGTEHEKVESAIASIKLLEAAESLHVPTRAFYWVRSQCHEILNQQEEAQRDLERFSKTAASTAFDYFLPGGRWRSGDLTAEIHTYENALGVEPDHFPSLHFLATRLAFAGRLAESNQVYRACIALRPDHAPSLLNRADVLRSIGQYEEALGLINRVIESETPGPSLIRCFRSRMRIYTAMGEYGQAEKEAQKAIELHPHDGEALCILAWFLLTCPAEDYQEPKEALGLAERAVGMGTSDMVVAWNVLGVAQYRVGDNLAAIESLQNSVGLRQRWRVAENAFFLAMSYNKVGQYDKAKEWYDDAVGWMHNHNPTDVELIQFRTEAEQALGIEARADELGGLEPG